jgi:hypothetical protein
MLSRASACVRVNRSFAAPSIRHGYPFRCTGTTCHVPNWRTRAIIDDLAGSVVPKCGIAVQRDAIIVAR